MSDVQRGRGIRLFLLSFLMLFVELSLIRWTSSNVVYIAYFANFVLLASFLGIGVGFMTGNRTRGRFERCPLLFGICLLLVAFFGVHVSHTDSRSFESTFDLPALPPWILLPVIFACVAGTLAAIASEAARAFATFVEPLDAYRIDVAGSLTGITTFAVLSFLHSPPIVWVVVSGMLFTILLWPLRRETLAGLIIALASVTPASLDHSSEWSPYYRVTAIRQSDSRVAVEVNGLPHQSIVSIEELARKNAFYFDPYEEIIDNPLRRVLIIGAGSGNDVAVALQQGAGHVDAVEIDPVLLRLGMNLHPDHPYQDLKVSTFVDDGRAFLQRTDRRYDLIVFALPDSLTQLSGQSSLRLESYLFTIEALEEARQHLRPRGAFTMYNYYRQDVFNRFSETLRKVFDEEPCITHRTEQLGPRQQAVLTVATNEHALACASNDSAAETTVDVATDDHPFPYLQGRRIPSFYLSALALIIVASLLTVRLFVGGLSSVRPYLDVLLMGVAFLLLETKSVVQFALLFGTTWIVNALVFAGILLAVYVAVEIARHVRLPRLCLLYVVLVASLAVAWFVPQEWLLSMEVPARFAVASVVTFSPVFLANLVFAQRFSEIASSAAAFGANLIGAMVGGVLEYLALVTGYRALLALIAIVYVAAYAVQRGAAKQR
jgi:hypothetical protein